MDLIKWRRRAAEKASAAHSVGTVVVQSVHNVVASGLGATASVAGEAYTAALNWKNNTEFSNWLADQFSNQRATIASKAMDAEYLRTYVGGSWHRLYDGGHTLSGSWLAVTESLPDLTVYERLGTWANEYWKDLITARGMPIIVLDRGDQVGEYLKHLDSINVAELIGGEVCVVSIYCNWNDPAKLIASATATDCSAVVYANVIAPLVNLIALGRAYFLLKEAEQDDLENMIVPALKGLTRSGATILMITVIPGGFLLHLSSGIIISLAHNYVWEKGAENKETILASLKLYLEHLQRVPETATHLARIKADAGSTMELPDNTF